MIYYIKTEDGALYRAQKQTLDGAIQQAKDMGEMYFPYSFVVVDENENIIWES